MKQKLPFEMIVRQHGPTVWRVCRVVLGPGPDAEDAWAETFAAALTAWQGLPDDVNTEAWLVRLAHRKAVDVVRGLRDERSPSRRFLLGPGKTSQRETVGRDRPPTPRTSRSSRSGTRRCGTPSTPCRSANGSRSPTIISAGCRTMRWPDSSVDHPRPCAGPPRTECTICGKDSSIGTITRDGHQTTPRKRPMEARDERHKLVGSRSFPREQ